MEDVLLNVQCTDCNTIVPFSFALGALVKGKTKLLLFGSCPTCKGRGDKRSLRCEKSYTGTLTSSDRFPVVLIGG